MLDMSKSHVCYWLTLSASWRPFSTALMKGSVAALRSALALHNRGKPHAERRPSVRFRQDAFQTLPKACATSYSCTSPEALPSTEMTQSGRSWSHECKLEHACQPRNVQESSLDVCGSPGGRGGHRFLAASSSSRISGKMPFRRCGFTKWSPLGVLVTSSAGTSPNLTDR
jgi:hypothetical protein